MKPLVASLVFLVPLVIHAQLKYEHFREQQGVTTFSAPSFPGQVREHQVDELVFNPSPLNVTEAIPPVSLLEWVDIDADHDMDFVAFSGGPAYVVKLYVNTDETFTAANSESNGLGMTTTAWYLTDINQDNLIDFMFVEARTIKIAHNNGDNTFSIENTGIDLEWDGANPLYCIDVDGDTDMDIITRPATTFWAIILSQKYGSPGAVAYPPSFQWMSFMNLDNVGTLDLFMISSGAASVIVSQTISQGNIYPVLGPTVTGTFGRFIWSDIDRDGDMDMYGRTSTGWVAYKSLLAQTGQPGLVKDVDITTSVSAGAVGDINGDGLQDLVVYDPPFSMVQIYVNYSTINAFEFVLMGTISLAAAGEIYLVDIDKQAGLDIIHNGVVYKNTLSDVGPPLQAPTGLFIRSINANNGVVQLSWQRTAPEHQYRVEIFKDGELFVSSESTDEGLLRYQRTPLYQPGIFLNSLPKGVYSFRVQSVDASFRTSPFSEIEEMDIPVGLDPSVTFDVYPNPTSTKVTILVPSIGKLTVMDNLSNVIWEQQCDPATQPTLEILTESWPAGIYCVRLETAEWASIRKLVVIK